MSLGELYLQTAIDKLLRIKEDAGQLKLAAREIFEALASGHFLYAFGTGHGHILSEEIFYRAGGLVRVCPILDDSLMLHVSATGSTELERDANISKNLLDSYPFGSGDIMIIISNSGRNAATVEMAIQAKARGGKVIALTSMAHSKTVSSRHPSGKLLYQVSDIVLDNMGEPGDAFIDVGGKKVSPTSTVVGAALLQALVAEIMDYAASTGTAIETFSSSNIDGGDEANRTYIEKYRGIIKSL